MASFAFLWGQPNAVLVFLALTILLLLILDNYFVNILFFGFFGLRVWLIFVAVLVIGMRLIFVRVVKCKDRRSSCSLGDSESGYQASRCYKLPNFNFFFFFNLPNSKKTKCQDGRVQDQAELPRGLRGVDQQADQHGILCFVRLSFHEFLVQPGRPSPPRIRWTFQDGVRGGARPWHEADGVPDQEGWKSGLPGHRQANHHGLGNST